MSPEAHQEINLSMDNLIHPITALRAFFRSEYFIRFAERAGYDKVEWSPLQGPVREILHTPSPLVITRLSEKVSSAHTHIHPEATLWSILTRQRDPLRPSQGMRVHNLAFVDSKTAVKALHRLERLFEDNLPIVTYPAFLENHHAYGDFKNPMLQPHPPAFEDKSSAQDIVNLIENGTYQGV